MRFCGGLLGEPQQGAVGETLAQKVEAGLALSWSMGEEWGR